MIHVFPSSCLFYEKPYFGAHQTSLQGNGRAWETGQANQEGLARMNSRGLARDKTARSAMVNWGHAASANFNASNLTVSMTRTQFQQVAFSSGSKLQASKLFFLPPGAHCTHKRIDVCVRPWSCLFAAPGTGNLGLDQIY
jgi:hypothetical protein